MAVAHLVSVNVGVPQQVTWTRSRRTAIDKRPQTGPVAVRRLGLQGDQVAHPRHHGGPDKAVSAYAVEDLGWWAGELGTPLAPAAFGENLTTSGIDLNAAEIGSRWAVGDAVLEVASVRTPCRTFATWQRRQGHEATGWLTRFTAAARPGPYLRVLQEGTLRVGDPVEVVHVPGHGVTVSIMFRALLTEPALLVRLLEVDGLTEQARVTAERHVAAAGATPDP